MEKLFFEFVLTILLIGELHCATLPWTEDVIVESENKPWDGREYSYTFKTLFGISRSERGELQRNENGRPYIDVKGKITFPIEGFVKDVYYKANDKGFDILNSTINSITRGNIADVAAKHGQNGDSGEIHFPVEETAVDVNAENTTLPYNTTDFDDRFGNVPPAVVATLLGG